ncbi:phosphopentomutase [Vibrio hangzhouensis]|uniref:phosphopentomutase n=1 Tax=Vibrio hangzhouensis TaxID=462991 RepID=UPI001C9743C2|nr:phosphopentomutase [Vibrio hangzhouensis]MBY6195983.1 phosphopentomutase [Vibrio hangzhouensis]
MKRTIVLVLDSLGIGSTQDASLYGDLGADTFGHIATWCSSEEGGKTHARGVLKIPNLSKLGLVHAHKESTGKWSSGLSGTEHPVGAYGFAAELSVGKDTPSGHWEMMGVPVIEPWGMFSNRQDSFPKDLLERIYRRAGLKGSLGNCHSSGTEVLDVFGKEHITSGLPIFYTSADSVFQIACHEESFGLERLYQLCEIVRDELDSYNIGRVIARPFKGLCKNTFKRTGNRKDYCVPPPNPTLLERLVSELNAHVIGIGKISDIFAGRGITKKVTATGIPDLFEATKNELLLAEENSLIFTNFVDFDSEYGHRRDVAGYARALEYFDSRVMELIELMEEEDILIITADHGCDPTWHGSDHTRENIPILVFGKNVTPGSFGRRESFADIAQSLTEYYGLSPMSYGNSFGTCFR